MIMSVYLSKRPPAQEVPFGKGLLCDHNSGIERTERVVKCDKGDEQSEITLNVTFRLCCPENPDRQNQKCPPAVKLCYVSK
jgi:hypothetical protein